MDEFKVGDRVMLSAKLQARLKFPHVGTVEAVNPRVCVTWPNGGQSNERLQDLKLVESAQPETSAAALMAYGAEKTELQRILTKRNATIGRLRVANRELRRDMFRTNKLMLEAQRDADEARFALKRATAEPEPGPLPTVPPRVGGVYRTRNGEEAEVYSRWNDPRYPFLVRMKGEEILSHAVTRDGSWSASEITGLDLVAEISPPPEPAFTGPLEVGGWYECSRNRVWQCWCIDIFGGERRYNLRQPGGTEHTWCRGDLQVRTSEDEHGRRVGSIIRKVDPPGGES